MLVASFSQHPGLCPQQLSLSSVLVLGLLFPLLLKLKIPQNTSSPLGFVCQGLAMGLPSAPQLQEGSKQGERRGQQEVSPVILREMVRCPQLQRYFPLIIGLKERCISKVTFCCSHQSPQTCSGKPCFLLHTQVGSDPPNGMLQPPPSSARTPGLCRGTGGRCWCLFGCKQGKKHSRMSHIQTSVSCVAAFQTLDVSKIIKMMQRSFVPEHKPDSDFYRAAKTHFCTN